MQFVQHPVHLSIVSFWYASLMMMMMTFDDSLTTMMIDSIDLPSILSWPWQVMVRVVIRDWQVVSWKKEK